MTEHTDHATDLGQEEFELERRGYSRRQVDEFAAKTRNHSRDLENRLSHALDENERIRLELSAARQAAGGRPAHEEISERVGQILKLADEEAKSQRDRTTEEIGKQRSDAKAETDRMRAEAKQETDKFRAEAQSQAERMLRAAQEQAENSVASARAEAEKTRNAARAEAERSITDAHKQSETAVGTAKAQAKQVLDEATARATAIHDGAERRLNLLMSRHTEAIRRLTEIRDVVTTLVAGEVARGSLEEEVEKAVASAIGDNKAAAGRPAGAGGPAGPAGPAEGRHAPAGPAVQAGPAGPAGPGGPAGGPAPGAAPAQAPAAPVIGQQVPGRVQPGPRTQPATAKPAEVSGAGNGQGARVPNGAAETHAAAARPVGPAEGARHAAGGDRPETGEDTADNVRIVPE
jgi:cell division septum initiation protein DivIVA